MINIRVSNLRCRIIEGIFSAFRIIGELASEGSVEALVLPQRTLAGLIGKMPGWVVQAHVCLICSVRVTFTPLTPTPQHGELMHSARSRIPM